MEKKEELRRSFGGKINNFKDKAERAFEDKHLKAYLKGHEKFTFGFKTVGNKREAIWFDVKEIWS